MEVVRLIKAVFTDLVTGNIKINFIFNVSVALKHTRVISSGFLKTKTKQGCI